VSYIDICDGSQVGPAPAVPGLTPGLFDPGAGVCDADEGIDTAAIPLECGLTVVCRAAADAETGGPAGRPALRLIERSARQGSGGRIAGLSREAGVRDSLPPVTRAWLAEKSPRRPVSPKVPRLTLRERREARREVRKAHAREVERTRAEARERELQAEFDASFHHPWGIR